MKHYEYSLSFSLAKATKTSEECTDLLFEAGCDDAVVGVGAANSIALTFDRRSDTAESAIRQSIAQVTMAIAGAELLEVKPDLVGLSDIAELVGCSRQNIRQLAADTKTPFPQPSATGSVPLWHFYEVGLWLMDNKRVKSKPTLESLEVSKTAFKLNMDVQHQRFERCVADNKPTY